MAANSSSFSELLQRYRRLAGLSQEDLAEQAQVSVRSISNLERGLSHPHYKTLTLLADALRLTDHARQEFVSAARPVRHNPPTLEARVPYITLPQPLTRLIGREQEVSAVSRMILQENARLVTLTGVAGIGKTRLALGVATQLQSHFPDGVVFVSLASLRDWRLIPSSVAQAMGIQEEKQQSLWDTISASLAPKTTMLVLDNLEHLIEGATFVVDLLLTCPSLVIVVTSRSALRVRGERIFLVPPLHIATDPTLAISTGSAAETLFVERAREVWPGFQLTAENAASVTAICQRLEGIPLAIELAAMRVTTLSPQDILHHLEYRLSLLVEGPRDLPQRQQTMRDAIAWSYAVLSSSQQALFRRLAIFDGGWTLSAAHVLWDEETEGDTLFTTLSALVEANLIHHWPEEDADNPRFAMLEVLREYGLEQLAASGERDGVQRRHAEYLRTLAQEAEWALRGPEQGRWLRWLDSEQNNLRAALQWAKEHDAQLGLSIVSAVWRYWFTRRHLREGISWLEIFLELTNERAELQLLRARASFGVSSLALFCGDFEKVECFANVSLQMYQALGDISGMCSVLNTQGAAAYFRDRYKEAEGHFHEALRLSRSIGDTSKISSYLSNLALLAIEQGCYADAQSLLEEGLMYIRELSDYYGITITLTNLSNVLRKQKKYDQAEAVAREALHFGEQSDNRRIIASALDELGRAEYGQGRYKQAITALEQSRQIHQELQDSQGLASVFRHLGDISNAQMEWQQAGIYYGMSIELYQRVESVLGVAKCLSGWAISHLGLDQAQQSAIFAGKAAAILEEIELSPQAGVAIQLEQTKRELQEAMGEDAFQTAWEQGKTLAIEELLPPR